MGKEKIHYIEVVSDSEEDENTELVQNSKYEESDEEQPQDENLAHIDTKDGTIASLSGTPRYNIFRVRGVS